MSGRGLDAKGADLSFENWKDVSTILKKDSLSREGTVNRNFQIHAKRAKAVIKLDGIINEQDWLTAEKAKDFYMVLPYDTGHSVAKSEVMMTYDDKAFYMAVVFYDTLPGKRPVESLRRDFVFGNNDNFLVFIDPYNDQTTGYSFGVNAAGANWDGTMSGGAAVNVEGNTQFFKRFLDNCMVFIHHLLGSYAFLTCPDSYWNAVLIASAYE